MSVGMRMFGPSREGPPNPEMGDCYFNPDTGEAFVWMGGWMLLVSNTEEFSGYYVIQEEP